MPEASRTYEGGCLCGTTRYRAAGPATHLCFCHCRSCRRASGAPFVAWGTFAAARFEVTAGALGWHASSAQAERGFCAVCGSALAYRSQRSPDEIDVALASLDEPESLAPVCHIWVSHKLSWVVPGDGLPQYPELAP